MQSLTELAKLREKTEDSLGIQRGIQRDPTPNTGAKPELTAGEEFTPGMLETDFSGWIKEFRDESLEIQKNLEVADKITPERAPSEKKNAHLMRRADTLWEAARYLEYIPKHKTLKDVVWWSKTARLDERQLQRRGIDHRYREEIQPIPHLSLILPELDRKLSKLEEKISTVLGGTPLENLNEEIRKLKFVIRALRMIKRYTA